MKIIINHDMPDDVMGAIADSLAEEGYTFEYVEVGETPLALSGDAMPDALDEEAVPLGSIAAYDTGTSFWRTEELAQRLYIATQEREELTDITEVNKLEALACFWLASNFVNVSAALAHSYGDEGLPVGSSFEDFVKTFLGEERHAELGDFLDALQTTL